ncbi:MAG: hypothetical protein PW790_06925 [Parvibaculaceae bacterium]|nr:hypothetical protein [Parvibaculaceae bacterium]
MRDDEPFDDSSGIELEHLEAEIPVLAGIATFTREARGLKWFSRLGEPIDQVSQALARSYLEGLGFPDVEVARIRTWDDAADAADLPDWDAAGWEAEEGMRASLTVDALEILREEALTIALQHLASELGPRMHQAATDAANRRGIEDESLIGAAAGSALRAAHGAALALAAGADHDHPFRRLFALYARGRWPIGIAGMTLNLF